MNKSMTLTVMKLRSNMLFSIQVSCANKCPLTPALAH